VSVSTETRLTNDDLLRGLNALLPDDIAVVALEDAPEKFHATYDAVGKTYRYQIHNGRVPSVFDRHYAWHYPHALDTDAMHEAGQVLRGCHDFSSFETAGSERPDSIRTIHQLSVRLSDEPNSSRVTVEITGDGFLYNMVREVLEACDRRRAGQTAPPHGLFLVSVQY
jgi:tRNA pseudouridine38-40 synthase